MRAPLPDPNAPDLPRSRSSRLLTPVLPRPAHRSDARTRLAAYPVLVNPGQNRTVDPTAPRRRMPASGSAVAPRAAQRRHVSGPTAPLTAPVLPAEPGVGDLVGGRYRIEAELGYGGMAHVYRARDERLQRDVAIKVFRAGVSEAVD